MNQLVSVHAHRVSPSSVTIGFHHRISSSSFITEFHHRIHLTIEAADCHALLDLRCALPAALSCPVLYAGTTLVLLLMFLGSNPCMPVMMEVVEFKALMLAILRRGEKRDEHNKADINHDQP